MTGGCTLPLAVYSNVSLKRAACVAFCHIGGSQTDVQHVCGLSDITIPLATAEIRTFVFALQGCPQMQRTQQLCNHLLSTCNGCH